jgi:hypothetical protein
MTVREQPCKRAAAKRALINTGTGKRYVRRDESGMFKESDDVGRSLPRIAVKRRRPRRDLVKVTEAIGERAVADYPVLPGNQKHRQGMSLLLGGAQRPRQETALEFRLVDPSSPWYKCRLSIGWRLT